MNAQLKYWVWVVAWSCSCLLAIMMQGSNSTMANDDAVKNDVVKYWEAKLHGARLPASVRGMVSPLSSHEATQLLVSIIASGGHYLPSHAATFCKATHIKCAHQTEGSEEGKEQTEVSEEAKVGKESQEGNKKLKEEASQASKELLPVHEISGFFRERWVLVSGSKIHVNFGGYSGDANADRAFLPRKLAKLFPLRGDGAEIASMLGVSQEDLQETLRACNSLAHARNEERSMCLTSLEDLADYVASILGTASPDGNIDALDAIACNASGLAELEKAGNTFLVLDVKEVKADRDEPSVTCHDMPFPFRVFSCHSTKQTKVFQVTLQGEDKSNVHQRTVACHYDTSYWSPQYRAFKDVQTKPGESEVCHWLAGWWLGNTAWAFINKATASAAVM